MKGEKIMCALYDDYLVAVKYTRLVHRFCLGAATLGYRIVGYCRTVFDESPTQRGKYVRIGIYEVSMRLTVRAVSR